MGMFGFSTRSLGRDRETDFSRFTRMQTTLGQVLAEIEREKAGLRKRFTRHVCGCSPHAGSDVGPERHQCLRIGVWMT